MYMYYLLNNKYKGFEKYWGRFMMNFSGDALYLLQTRENYVLIYMYRIHYLHPAAQES